MPKGEGWAILQGEDFGQFMPSLVADNCLKVVDVDGGKFDVPGQVHNMLDGRTSHRQPQMSKLSKGKVLKRHKQEDRLTFRCFGDYIHYAFSVSVDNCLFWRQCAWCHGPKRKRTHMNMGRKLSESKMFCCSNGIT